MKENKEILRLNKAERLNAGTQVNAKVNVEQDAKIINVWAKSTLARCEILNGEIVLDGNVHFTCVYKTADEIKTVEHSEHFSFGKEEAALQPKSLCFLQCNAEHIKCYAEAGSLMFSCNVCISGSIVTSIEKEIITGFSDKNIITKETVVESTEIVFCEKIRTNKQQEVRLSMRLPEADRILYTDTSAYVNEARVSAGQLLFTGTLNSRITYISGDDSEPIVQVSDSAEFNEIVDLKNTAYNGYACLVLNCDNVSSALEPDESGEKRIINLITDLSGTAYATAQREITVIADAYSTTERLECKNEKIVYSDILCNDSFTANERIGVRLPESKTPISRLNSVDFNASVAQTQSNDKEIAVSGDVSVIYTTAGENAVDGFNESITFTVKNEPGFSASDVIIKDVQAVLLSGSEIEIRATLSFISFGSENKELSVAECADIADNEELPEFGIIIYNVQPNEDMWSVCKKYGVTEESITSLNPDLTLPLKANDRLFIFRQLTVN